jgi:hypothetical protein
MINLKAIGDPMTTYLPLTNYSAKYKVSLSTLRRRIKAEDIQFMFEDGRYLVLDEPMGSYQRLHRPSQGKQVEDSLVSSPYDPRTIKEMAPSFGSGPPAHTEATLSKTGEEPILTAANRLLTELKKAYTQILQEREEQILHLKEEVADLKTLVRVLESENDRLNKDLL